ncbi:MAG: glycosyltransferase family 2 protein [Ignavibacteria bacterium]|nr:glycosyltransferase family 2 protein [Ignavibacteria bacterium]
MDNFVSVIILNFNGRDYLYPCLDSVLKQTYKNFEVIFVDNGSDDDSVEFVKQNFKDGRIRIFQLNSNLGFAGGNNFGLKQSKGDLIVLLNNDTKVERNWLKELVDSINIFDNAGLVQSLIKTENIPERYYMKNGSINFLGHNIMEVFPIDENGKGMILLAGGASLIFRRDLLKEDKIFPEEYFFYSEDTYLSLYSLFSGKINYHNSKSIVYHSGSKTIKSQNKILITFYQERNRILNFLIFFKLSFLLKIIPYFIFNFIVKILISTVTNKYSLLGIIRSYYWILTNLKFVKRERERISRLKLVPDEKVIGLLTYKLFNGNNILERIINVLSKLYCILMRIKTYEFIK